MFYFEPFSFTSETSVERAIFFDPMRKGKRRVVALAFRELAI